MLHVPYKCIALYQREKGYFAFNKDATTVGRLCRLEVVNVDGTPTVSFPRSERKRCLTRLIAASKRVVLVGAVLCPY